MTKRLYIGVGCIAFLVVLGVGTSTASYALAEPPSNPAYLTAWCQQEHATLEQVLADYVSSLPADQPSLYREALEYKTGISAHYFRVYSGSSPTIVESHDPGDCGSIWTSNGWEVNFRLVGGRRVLQPESSRLYVLGVA